MILENTDINGPTVLLMDWHGEYTGGLDQVKGYEDGKYCRSHIVWDGYALGHVRTRLGIEGDEDDAVNAAFRSLFADKLDPVLDLASGDASSVYIWEIGGHGIERAFTHLLNALDTVPSGDDDTFDYWPNTMEMLWEFACDLDSIDSSTSHRDRVHTQGKRIRDELAGQEWAQDSGVDDPTEMQGSAWLEWKS